MSIHKHQQKHSSLTRLGMVGLFLIVTIMCGMNVRGGQAVPPGTYLYQIILEDNNAPCNQMKINQVKAYAVYGDIGSGTCIPGINGQYYKVSCNSEGGKIKWGCNRSCSYCMSEDAIAFKQNGCGFTNGGCGPLPFDTQMLWNIQFAQTPDNNRGDCSSYPVNIVGEPTNQCVKTQGVLSDWQYGILHCNGTGFKRDVSDQRCGGPNKYFSEGKLNECKYNTIYTC